MPKVFGSKQIQFDNLEIFIENSKDLLPLVRLRPHPTATLQGWQSQGLSVFDNYLQNQFLY